MRFAVVAGLIIKPCVFNNDLASKIRLPRFHKNAQRISVRVKTVLNSVLNKRLQRQRRHIKVDMRRVVIHKKHILVLRLFHGKIRARVFNSSLNGTVFSLAIAVKFLRK